MPRYFVLAVRCLIVTVVAVVWAPSPILAADAGAQPQPVPPGGASGSAVTAATPVTPPPATPTEQTKTSSDASIPGDEPDEHEILIIKALEQPTKLDVQNTPIQKALQQLADSTGIPIRLAAGTASLLPYGSQTNLTAKIENQPLKESLTALLRPLGLQFAPQHDHVLVSPVPPLYRMSRRASWEEVDLLKKLATTPWSKDLFDSLQFQFQDSPAADAAANRETLGRLADAIGAGQAAEVLEHACLQHGWVWSLNGNVIVVSTKTRQIEKQLDRRVSLRYVQANLKDALMDLAARAGVLLHFDPGVLASLPPQTAERFSLSMENTTIRQALEIIAGETGLMYFIEADGVRISNNLVSPATGTGPAGAGGSSQAQVEATAQATAAALRATSVIGQISFPLNDGTTASFYLRQGDLPPEVNEMRKIRIDKAINQLRKHLSAEQRRD
ncbi:MAG TPA: hypothetical protein PKY77_10310 [Phycisphaerae bacterium]|nr:hypothetical protein [Phycisphaerae bacterium]HRY69971.1 hypothetical protein [Phycisphaerae bacterium]HSA27180.1 hypothetical protein [Phycisphaerae bacterium]